MLTLSQKIITLPTFHDFLDGMVSLFFVAKGEVLIEVPQTVFREKVVEVLGSDLMRFAAVGDQTKV